MAETRACLGCGSPQVVQGGRYCRRCKKRLRDGTPLDLEAYPSAPPSRAKRRQRRQATGGAL